MKKITKLLKYLSKQWIEIIDKCCCRSCGFSEAETDNAIIRTRQSMDFIYWTYPNNIVEIMNKLDIKYDWDWNNDRAIRIIE